VPYGDSIELDFGILRKAEPRHSPAPLHSAFGHRRNAYEGVVVWLDVM